MIPSVLPTYNRAPLAFVSGTGSWLLAEDGRRYLDLGGGIAVRVVQRGLLAKGLFNVGQRRIAA